jgi:hypothetical protein
MGEVNTNNDFDFYINRGINNWKKGEYEQAAANYATAFNLGVKSDYSDMNRFAEIRFADAQFFLGKTYLNGSFGLQKNEALGVELILWGATNNQKDSASILNEIEKKANVDPNLQYCLGRAYMDINLLKARKYLKKAVKNGNKDATEFYSEYSGFLTFWMLKENRSYIFGAIMLVEFVVLNLLFKNRGGSTLFFINNIAVASFVGAFLIGPLKNFIFERLVKLIASNHVIRTIYWCYLGLSWIVGILYGIVVIIQCIRGVTRNKLFLFLEDPFGFIENSIHSSITSNLQQSKGVSGWVVILTAIAVLVCLLLLWFIIRKIITNVKTVTFSQPVSSVQIPQAAPKVFNASVPADFIGTWRWYEFGFADEHYTIFSDKIVFTDKKGNGYFNLTITNIKACTNTDIVMKNNYPSGYTFTGKITESTYNSDDYKVGTTRSHTFFLKNDKTAFVQLYEDGHCGRMLYKKLK